MGFSLGISSSQTTNAAGNQTTVYCTLTLYSGGNSYAGYNTSWGMSIGGASFGGAGPTELWNPNSWSTTQSYTFTHDINGYRGDAACYVSFSGSGGYSPPYMEAGPSTQGAVNFDRKPAGISSASAVVNADKSVTVSYGGGGSPGGSPALSSTYHVSYSKAGAAHTGDFTGTGSSITIPAASLAPGFNYVFRVWATNGSNDGAGASLDTASVFVPSGGKIYTGTAWVPATTGKIYNGTAWVNLSTAKIYNGSSWVNLT
jgi:hypothetical protein